MSMPKLELTALDNRNRNLFRSFLIDVVSSDHIFYFCRDNTFDVQIARLKTSYLKNMLTTFSFSSEGIRSIRLVAKHPIHSSLDQLPIYYRTFGNIVTRHFTNTPTIIITHADLNFIYLKAYVLLESQDKNELNLDFNAIRKKLKSELQMSMKTTKAVADIMGSM